MLEGRQLEIEGSPIGLSALTSVRQVIAVVGCQRSGTTLTGQLIGAHPSCMLIDEFDGLYPWFHALRRGDGELDSLTEQLVEKAAAKYRQPDQRVQVLNGAMTLAADIDTLVLKAPNLTFDETALATLPVPVRIVLPVRDPRSVVVSMARLEQIDIVGNQLRLLAERPIAAAQYAEEIAEIAGHPDRPWVNRSLVWRIKSGRRADFERVGLLVHSFRYEDLVASPDETTSAMLQACGLTPSMSADVYVGEGPGGTVRSRPVDAHSLQTWSAALSPAQQAEVLQAAGPLARQFGYE